jgi:hypothetical protein
MKKLLIGAALVVMPVVGAAQDYAPNFQFQSFVFDPQKTLQRGYPLTPELPAVTKPHNTMDRLSDLNIETNPQPVPTQPVQVQPIDIPEPIQNAPKPESVKQAKPERIPWPEPGYNCCWPQNISGSLFVDPDVVGGEKAQ